jgi:pantothenate kinase
MITNGNSMKWYLIIREHDYKLMAKVKGYDFAFHLLDYYIKVFPRNKFIIQDKNQNNAKIRKRSKKQNLGHNKKEF